MSRRELLGAHNPGTINMRWDATTNSFLVWDGSAFVQIGPLSAWTAYTPTLSSGWLLGNATYTASYMRVGRGIIFATNITIGSTTTKGTVMVHAVPVTAANAEQLPAGLHATCRIYVTGYFPLHVLATSTATVETGYVNAASTAAVSAPVTATLPATWATGDVIKIGGVYEAAA